MPKDRVYQVAKRLGVESNDLIKRLEDIKVDVKNHMSTINGDDVSKLLDKYPEYRSTWNNSSQGPIKWQSEKPTAAKGASKKNDQENKEARKSGITVTITEDYQQEGEKYVPQTTYSRGSQKLHGSRSGQFSAKGGSKQDGSEQAKTDESQQQNTGEPAISQRTPTTHQRPQSQKNPNNNRQVSRERQNSSPQQREAGAGNGDQTQQKPALRQHKDQESQPNQDNQIQPAQQQNEQSGQKRTSQQRYQSGQRQPNQQHDRSQQNRPNQQRDQSGQRQPYQQSNQQRDQSGQRQPYQQRDQSGQRQPYQQRDQSGQRQPNQQRDQSGQRQPNQQLNQQRDQSGQRQPNQQRDQSGQRQPYQQRDQSGQRQPYQQRDQSGQRQPYQQRDQSGQRRPRTGQDDQQKPGDDRQRAPSQQRDRAQFQKRDGTQRPFRDKPQGTPTDKDQNQQRDRSRVPQTDRNRSPQGEKGKTPLGDKSRVQSGDKSRVQSGDKSRSQTQQRGPQRSKQVSVQQKGSRLQPHKMVDLQKVPAQKSRPSKKTRHQKQLEAELAKAAIAEKVAEEEQALGIVLLPKMIRVKELAEKLRKPTSDVIKALMKRGIMANLNQEIDYYNASHVAEDFEFLVDKEEEVNLLEEAFAEEVSDEGEKTERPPVVVVMGHVDHGKTSLLDRIRKSNVTDKEAGGITQHIGAYTVSIADKMITFLDTPGHEAFTAMRMRGAQVTDIAVLVVAADDGVMPQTIEAINHARAAEVEIIVAINKIDKPSANPDRVKQELTEYGLLSESWGGDTICVDVSAATGDGIDTLLEMITVVAEMRELKANATKHARGTVIEAMLDKGRGPVATILVQSGVLNVGDPVVAGATYGKVRAMTDDKGQKLKKAGPSMPVEILGLSEVPLAGDMFYVANNEKQARVLSESVKAKGREELAKAVPKVSLDDLFVHIQAGNIKELNLVVKADVQGSVEAVKNSLERLSTDEVRIRTIHGGVGAITESDVMLASASNAIIIGFNVRPEAQAKSVADDENVDVRLYRIIYNAIEDITAAMKGMLDPVFAEKTLGHAEIRQIFKASSIGTIAGSYITDGKIIRNAKCRLIRDGKEIYSGTIDALKRFKDDAKEVNTGYECGILLSKYNDIKEGDIIEAYIMEEIPR